MDRRDGSSQMKAPWVSLGACWIVLHPFGEINVEIKLK